MYERAFRGLRDSQPDAKEEAVMLLEAWRAFEAAASSRPAEEAARAVAAVEKKMPRRVKRKRPIVLDDGSQPGGMEEYYDYIFPVGVGGRGGAGCGGVGGHRCCFCLPVCVRGRAQSVAGSARCGVACRGALCVVVGGASCCLRCAAPARAWRRGG